MSLLRSIRLPPGAALTRSAAAWSPAVRPAASSLWTAARSQRPLFALAARPRTEHFTCNRSWPTTFPPFFERSFSSILRPFHLKRSFATASATANATPPKQDRHIHTPTLTHPVVAYYLLGVAALVFSLVVIGGLTRLTESGLSITEWNLVTGVLPPLSKIGWQEELDKYLQTPEGESMNRNISMGDFQFIYGMEWGHRLLGRLTGLVFLAPIPYFAYKKMLSAATSRRLLLIGTLIGAQGALGWYMVKSGLTREALAEANPSGVPRVSQYRLAAHLGMAFAVFGVCVREALAVIRDWEVGSRGVGVGGVKNAAEAIRTLQKSGSVKMRGLLTALTALVFTTALSGAFVAGLDAGLLYNSFPTMGEGRLAPPLSELMDSSYARKSDQSDLIRRNIFENPSTVQFDHRMLAISTWTATLALFLYARRPAIRRDIPPQALRHVKEIFAMASVQATLGISTLWYLVPTWLASLHQQGSLVLLTLCIAGGASLRNPGYAARLWLRRAAAKTQPPTAAARAQVVR